MGDKEEAAMVVEAMAVDKLPAILPTYMVITADKELTSILSRFADAIEKAVVAIDKQSRILNGERP